jgi:hypothetical protein
LEGGINNFGEVLFQKKSPDWVNCLWSLNSGLKAIPCYGFKVNDYGKVLGWNSVCDVATGKLFILKPLPGDNHMDPMNINNRGEAIGSSMVTVNDTIPNVRAVFYDSAGLSYDMGLKYYPDDGNQSDSLVYAINNNQWC